MSTYGFCANHCKKEIYEKGDVYSKTETDFNFIKLNKFATVTGTITMPEANASSNVGTAEVSYPSGFQMDNCVILSVMSKLHTSDREDVGYATSISNNHASVSALGNGDTLAYLCANNIVVGSHKTSNEAARADIDFKVVLMKLV